MQILQLSQRLVSLSVAIIILASPLLAQQRRSSPPRKTAPTTVPEPAPTFDSLLASESYKVYCEVRGVGGLVRSSAVSDLLEPVMKLGRPPKEFRTLVTWLNAHAEVLASSRMMVAGWPSRPKLPTVLVAIEFSTPEEAKKFYPALRDFLPTLLPTPTPTPSPASAPSPATKPVQAVSGGSSSTRVSDSEVGVVPLETPQNIGPVAEKEPAPAAPPYQMKQAGSLVLISDTAFTFRNLRPPGSKALEEDQNFLLARNRFASESLFLYVDLKSIEKEEKDRRQKWEEEDKKRIEAEAANPSPVEMGELETEVATSSVDEQPVPPPEPTNSSPTIAVVTPDSQTSNNATLGTGELNPMMFSLYGALFGGESKWPEAVGAALVFEGDAYVVRTLIINSAENKGNAIPFVPQFVSGPALVPESPNIFPADIGLFVSVSLDYPQVYDGMLKALANAEAQSRKYGSQPAKDTLPAASPFAIYEKKLGLKIKDDLLPLLGNELALTLPRKTKQATNEASSKPDEGPPAAAETEPRKTSQDPNPVIAISVKDREAVGRLIPRIIEAFGLKGANLFAQTEKRDGTEIVSYGGFFSYAFVGDFLVVSPDAQETRHVVDAYLNHQTLSANSHFRNFTRWQPRQVLGQVYVAPDLVEHYTSGSGSAAVNDKMSEFLTGVNPVIDPLTYALSNDGLGPLHELHIPKNLLQLIIAGTSSELSQQPLQANEAMARTALHSLLGSEAAFRSDKGAGQYATLEELQSEGLINKQLLENYGYRVELTVSGDKFEAIAVPVEYGNTGRISFFIDESGVLRGGDHGGGAATVADQPVE